MKSKWDDLRSKQENVSQRSRIVEKEQGFVRNQILENKRIMENNESNIGKNFYNLQEALTRRNQVNVDIHHLTDVTSRIDELVDHYDNEFKKATGLKRTDFVFLFTAIALQCVRQYVLTDAKWGKNDRPNDKEAAGNHKYERSERNRGYYYTTVDEILTNPVPFDTQVNSKKFGENLGGGTGHRFATLGHDPILGWIFGTANIATRTVTLSSFNSYHVKYGLYGKRMSDYFSENADTGKVLQYGLVDNAMHLNNGILVASFIKEAVHLKSDVNSKESLSIPGVATLISPKFAQQLSEYGINMNNILTVGKQASYAMVINLIISMLHRLLYNEKKDGDIKLYEVRTRKIISYSNTIASVSNVLYVAIATYLGDTKAVNKLDVGGILVAIVTVLRNGKIQQEIYEEFMSNRWYQEVMD